MKDGEVGLHVFDWHSGVIIAIIVCSSHKDRYEAANAELNDWTSLMPAWAPLVHHRHFKIVNVIILCHLLLVRSYAYVNRLGTYCRFANIPKPQRSALSKVPRLGLKGVAPKVGPVALSTLTSN